MAIQRNVKMWGLSHHLHYSTPDIMGKVNSTQTVESSDGEGDDDESDTSAHCNIIPPSLQPIPNTISPNNFKEDNDIKLLKPGIQVCAFEYNILPPIGVYYRVNNNHRLVKVIIEPGIIYQADNECNLYRVGLPYAKNSTG